MEANGNNNTQHQKDQGESPASTPAPGTPSSPQDGSDRAQRAAERKARYEQRRAEYRQRRTDRVHKRQAKRTVKHAQDPRPSADDRPKGVRALKPSKREAIITLLVVVVIAVGLSVEGLTPVQAVGKAKDNVVLVVKDFKKKVKKAKEKREGHDKELYGDNTWRTVAMNAEYYFDVDAGWTDTVLAMIKVESDGDIYIDDQGDIMQTAEGDGSKYLYNGVPEKGVEAGTPEASIYAGVFELRECIRDFRKYMGRDPNPKDEDDVGLIAQGYNYGHAGWFRYCRNNGVDAWSLDASQDYQNQIGGVGTANHGGKVQQAWNQIREEKKKG
ncbi:MAG: lysozyme family protein [Coriobacteriia bacterium]|nr:lysozyme family protein [Coriobacteriia bacterium]